MSIKESIAQWAAQWFQRFQDRHGLASVQVPVQAEVVLPVRTLLHVGCGGSDLASIPGLGFRSDDWDEVRLDADATVNPDIVGTMVDMAGVADGYADALYSSHGIEHLYWHDVPKAFAEFRRVLKPSGFAVITCPDIQAAAEMIAQDRLFDTAYESPSGSITPFDILYSYRPFVEANPQWMSHHCGFTLTTLFAKLKEAGFLSVYGFRDSHGFALWVLACKADASRDELLQLAHSYLPSHSDAVNAGLQGNQ